MSRVVITGSSKGIGLGMAKVFLEKGHEVVIVGSSEESTSESYLKLKDKYPNTVHGISCNVSIAEEVKNLSEKAISLMGGYDIWINNAGITQTTIESHLLEDQDIKHIIDVNIHGVINGSKAALNHFYKVGSGALYNMEGLGSDGRIVKKIAYYGATKRFVRYYTRVLAKENTSDAIIVARLSPGMVITDLLLKDIDKSKNKEKSLKIFSILADRVEVVTPYLVNKILANQKNGVLIAWLTSPKIIFRFLTSSFIKRKPFDN